MREDRALRIDPVAFENFSDEVRLEFLIFLRERIDRRIEKILRNRELPGKFRRGKHRSIIPGNEFFEEVPDRAVRMRKIDVAAPGPVICSRFAGINQSRRLRVVDHHEFGVERKSCAVPFVVREKNLEIPRARTIRRAVQRVVKRLGHFKEILAAGHDVPFDVEFQFFRQRHQAVENLRHAAADGRGVDHLDAAAAQGLGQRAQLFDFSCAQQFGIVVQRNAAQRQRLAHAFLLSRSMSRSSLAREPSNVLV